MFMVTAIIFHISIFLFEIGYLQYTRRVLGRQELPETNPALERLIGKDQSVYKKQRDIANRGTWRRVCSILSTLIDFTVIVAFFSHRMREAIMKRLRGYRSLVRINCSHIREPDVNFLVGAFFILGTKATVLEWAFNKNDGVLDLIVRLGIQIFRCTVIAPILIWMFSSVYSKTKWGLVLSSYVAIVILILIVNCTSLVPDLTDDLEVVPPGVFGERVEGEIDRLGLRNKVFWDKSDQLENAALVKTGAARHVMIMGNLLKYGKEEFIAFVAHEIGHAVDYSTEKKLVATVFGLGLTCGGMLSTLHFISPKYEARGVSRFSVLAFAMLANIYIVSSMVNMFYNNLGILSEINADLYAKGLGYGRHLAKGLYALTVANNAPLFHSAPFTHYIQDHPTVSSRIGYLEK
ncbi:STE24 endopeptidase [Nematocida homosporus]|uniref:STE24 endopeptidase n=1 Tax=Nematocida homosporus TaxID=1912981 RepID=UPI00221E9DA4|nr:STE24 endopeptidase [Nematocida homosporus]KAI5184964.1 STE24 endopeptidase [Nematocida homosporus]